MKSPRIHPFRNPNPGWRVLLDPSHTKSSGVYLVRATIPQQTNRSTRRCSNIPVATDMNFFKSSYVEPKNTVYVAKDYIYVLYCKNIFDIDKSAFG
jgi:hypothetical protein